MCNKKRELPLQDLFILKRYIDSEVGEIARPEWKDLFCLGAVRSQEKDGTRRTYSITVTVLAKQLIPWRAAHSSYVDEVALLHINPSSINPIGCVFRGGTCVRRIDIKKVQSSRYTVDIDAAVLLSQCLQRLNSHLDIDIGVPG